MGIVGHRPAGISLYVQRVWRERTVWWWRSLNLDLCCTAYNPIPPGRKSQHLAMSTQRGAKDRKWWRGGHQAMRNSKQAINTFVEYVSIRHTWGSIALALAPMSCSLR
ncbi:hypothetical protein DMENIID0001_163850 [Sergentomyia squamirostris]